MKKSKRLLINQILHLSTTTQQVTIPLTQHLNTNLFTSPKSQDHYLYNLTFTRKRHGPRWVDGYPAREPSYDRYGKPKSPENPLAARTKHERKLQATFTRINTWSETMKDDQWGKWLTWTNKKGKKAPRPNSIRAQVDRLARIDDKPVDKYDINEHTAPYEKIKTLNDDGDIDDFKIKNNNNNELGKGNSPLRILGII